MDPTRSENVRRPTRKYPTHVPRKNRLRRLPATTCIDQCKRNAEKIAVQDPPHSVGQYNQIEHSG